MYIDEAEVEAALALDLDADTEILEANIGASPTKKRKTRAPKKSLCFALFYSSRHSY